MKILITGATGYIGQKLVEVLAQKDWVEKIIGTDIKAPDRAFPKFTFVQRDIRASLDDLFEKEGIDTVVHTAYVLPPIHNKSMMEDINKGGTRNVLEASRKAGIRQILYTSSTTAYGCFPDNDRPLLETSPLRGNDDFTYAKNKKEIEGMIADFSKRHPEITVTVVRPCFVVGPGFKNPLAEHLQKKWVMLPANTKPWQFVHEDDLTEAMALLLNKKIGGAFNVTGDGTMTFPEMVAALGNTMLPLPWWLIYPLNNLSWYLRLTFMTKFPSPPLRMMVNPWIVSGEKLKRETGFVFKYDSRMAFMDFVKAVKKGK